MRLTVDPSASRPSDHLVALPAITMSAPASPSLVPIVRSAVSTVAALMGFSEDDAYGIKVAVSEAVANAVEHGSPRGPVDTVECHCVAADEGLVVEVRDEGGGFAPRAPQSLDSLDPRGRGLFFIEHFMDEVSFEPASPGTRIRMVKRVSQCPQMADSAS
jgi:anti-sigma regulatory factor (Ser/Thr protein kinase)